MGAVAAALPVEDAAFGIKTLLLLFLVGIDANGIARNMDGIGRMAAARASIILPHKVIDG
jgi:hypothetical protein